MTKTHYFGLKVLFYVSVAAACPAASAQQQEQFRLVHDTFTVVSLQMNDLGPFDFILDTGTDTTLVDPRLASLLSLAPLDRMTLTTPVGKQVLVRSSLRRVALGSAAVSDVEVLVEDMPELRKLDPHLRGILGQNFLSHFNYALDYRRRLLHLESQNELRDSTIGKRVPLEATGSRMVIQAEMPSLGIAKAHLLLDSGSSDLVLFRKMEQLSPSQLGGNSSLVNSRSDSLEVAMLRIHSLTIGDQHFHDIKLALLSPGAGESRPEDGLLPTILFRALYVNNREGFVIFNPRFDIREPKAGN
ncbi:MAG: aspartyl protease family protein [Acidobacteriia bacterium]|nr:aspartyl protease family protein [Terriglobia bacterium]